MPRTPRIPILATFAFTATALLTVFLPSGVVPANSATPDAILMQTVTTDATLERVAPEPRGRPVVVAVATLASADTADAAEAPEAPQEPTPAPLAVAAPVIARRVVPTAAPPQPALNTPPPAACPTTFFCYPRLGIAGAIVPYNDCSGATDVGVAIRQLTCIRTGIWLAGHAYTQFGGITGYRAGDVVFVRGQRFEITGAIVQRSCEPVGAIAPLSLQTSLETATCGRVLVVQGR
jgi:hypothetical protein